MSGHADTIRDYITNTERYDGRWHRLPTDDETLVALDALLAENQQLREALGFYARYTSYENATPRTLRPVIDDQGEIAREALAGAMERDPNTSPFDTPSFETVEKGIDWIDRRVHGDDS